MFFSFKFYLWNHRLVRVWQHQYYHIFLFKGNHVSLKSWTLNLSDSELNIKIMIDITVLTKLWHFQKWLPRKIKKNWDSRTHLEFKVLMKIYFLCSKNQHTKFGIAEILWSEAVGSSTQFELTILITPVK